jgi:hypothetical protein
MEDIIYLTCLKGTGHVMSSTLTNVGYSITFYPIGHMSSGEKSATEKIKER